MSSLTGEQSAHPRNLHVLKCCICGVGGRAMAYERLAVKIGRGRRITRHILLTQTFTQTLWVGHFSTVQINRRPRFSECRDRLRHEVSNQPKSHIAADRSAVSNGVLYGRRVRTATFSHRQLPSNPRTSDPTSFTRQGRRTNDQERR